MSQHDYTQGLIVRLLALVLCNIRLSRWKLGKNFAVASDFLSQQPVPTIVPALQTDFQS